MYSRGEKLKAVELFIKYDKSPASVIRGFGYSCRATLYAWYEEYLANGCRMPSIACTPSVLRDSRSPRRSYLLDSHSEGVYDAAIAMYKSTCAYCKWEDRDIVTISGMTECDSMASSSKLEEVREFARKLA